MKRPASSPSRSASGSTLGAPKYQKKSCTSSGVLRNSETYAPLTRSHAGRLDERPAATTTPSSVAPAATSSEAPTVTSQPSSSQPR
ncbi:hypothetical protein D9M68_787240 [compost metagenome]